MRSLEYTVLVDTYENNSAVGTLMGNITCRIEGAITISSIFMVKTCVDKPGRSDRVVTNWRLKYMLKNNICMSQGKRLVTGQLNFFNVQP